MTHVPKTVGRVLRCALAEDVLKRFVVYYRPTSNECVAIRDNPSRFITGRGKL